MTDWALYSEIDPFAAAWLQNLIAAGLIMPGVVDTRSLEDLTPDECNEFTQVHLCAGIGVWSHALRLAGWEDHRACWTASFPCQPFSAAGKGAAFADERHIWPAGHWLIDECRPAKIFGEQVASKDGLAWLDVVSSDLETSGYAVGTADLCAAGVGGPHIRQRSYWVADAVTSGWSGQCGGGAAQEQRIAKLRTPDRLADMHGQGLEGQNARTVGDERPATHLVEWPFGMEHDSSVGREQRRPEPGGRGTLSRCGVGGVDEPSGKRRIGWKRLPSERDDDGPDAGRIKGNNGQFGSCEAGDGARPAGPTDGYWRDADWLYCRDGKWRPVEPGTFPLVARPAGGVVRSGDICSTINVISSSEGRVGRLRGYGNALCAPVATAFIAAVMECMP